MRVIVRARGKGTGERAGQVYAEVVWVFESGSEYVHMCMWMSVRG